MGAVNDVVSVGTFGLVKDVTGTDAAEKGARRAASGQARAAMSAAELQAELGRESIEFQKESLAETRAGLEPFREAGVGSLGGLQSAMAQQQDTIEDPSARVLNNPFFQALAGQQEQRLLQSAAARGKVGSGGTNQGLQQNLLLLGQQFGQQDIANQQLGISNLQNLSTIGANAAAGQGSATQQTAGMVGQTLGGIGQAQAQGITGAANAQAAGQIAKGNIAQQNFQNLVSAGTTAASAYFSDMRLKENIEFSHVENGINIYNWNWSDAAKAIVGDQDTTGPLAQELRKTHPELVIEDQESGYLKVLM